VAVGDADNDLPMLTAAGLSVAMRNSMPRVLGAAQRVIGHNNSDTIAELVEELFG
jgi:hydroxymethylpyrimidine pyrophosphatase-like HAD family hydrolase